ncbi:MAG: HAD family hydrolase [Candidatus Ventricola sp.]
MIKLIASDMDGTLLDSQKRMPEGFADAVRALRARGVSFAIASGRQYHALRRDMEALVPELLFIAENGALIMENDRQVFIDPLPTQTLEPTLRAARGLEGVYAAVCRAGCAMVESSASREFIDSMTMYYASTQVVDNLADACRGLTDVCKIAFYDDGDAATHEYPALRAALPDTVNVILSGEHWVDIMKPGVNKGRALRSLMAQRGLTPDECMAFGDYLNDVELLEAVGESYAMDNALPEIKRLARRLAPSNDEDGVLHVLRERFAL